MTFSLPVSVALATSAIFLFVIANPGGTRPVFRVTFFAGLFLFLVITISHLIADFFTNHGIDDSVIFHLVYGLKGAGFREYSTLIFLSIAAFAISVSLLFGISRAGKRGIRASWFTYLSLILLITSLIVHPVAKLFLGQSTVIAFTEKFEDYYHEPIVYQSQIDDRKNLVFIYTEGLERTWLDEGLFPNVAPNLSKFRESALDFSNIVQMPYTSWTVAGIVASQCGLPLVTPSHGNGMSGVDVFLPGATCVGELLKANGYRIEFYGGADLEFAGKGNFFRTHGFDSVNGRKELAKLFEPESLSGWGLYDDDLLEFTYNRFEELSAERKPFALFTLTLDTHHPKGIPSKTCTNSSLASENAQTTMHFAVKCSDFLISRFIQKIRKSPYSERTLVVVVSDHLSMKSVATSYLERGDRKELFLILPGWGDWQGQIDKPGSVFDIGATTLSFLGIETSIGFGRNLLKEESAFAVNQSNRDLFKYWSNHFTEFWEFPNLGEGITSYALDGTLRIGNTTVRTPVLIQFDAKLDTKLVFDDFAGEPLGVLDTTYRKLAIGAPFAYVTNCGKFSEAANLERAKETCLLLGKKGGQDNKLIYLNQSPRLGKQEFIRVIQQTEMLDMK